MLAMLVSNGIRWLKYAEVVKIWAAFAVVIRVNDLIFRTWISVSGLTVFFWMFPGSFGFQCSIYLVSFDLFHISSLPIQENQPRIESPFSISWYSLKRRDPWFQDFLKSVLKSGGLVGNDGGVGSDRKGGRNSRYSFLGPFEITLYFLGILHSLCKSSARFCETCLGFGLKF